MCRMLTGVLPIAEAKTEHQSTIISGDAMKAFTEMVHDIINSVVPKTSEYFER